MPVSISGVLLLGLLIALLLNTRRLGWWQFLPCSAFGFLIAETAAAPVVQTALASIGGLLGQLRF